MIKRSKRYKNSVDILGNVKSSVLTFSEAVEKMKYDDLNNKFKCRFDESIDVAVNLNLKKGLSVRDVIVLPNSGFIKPKRILVLVDSENLSKAEVSGADIIGGEDLVDKIYSGWSDFDIVISTPSFIKKIVKIAPLLGRKGIMPSVKTSTLTFDIKKAVDNIRKGSLSFRSDKFFVVHFVLGKISMDTSDLLENYNFFIDKLKQLKPASIKGDLIDSVFVSKTMGVSLRVSL